MTATLTPETSLPIEINPITDEHISREIGNVVLSGVSEEPNKFATIEARASEIVSESQYQTTQDVVADFGLTEEQAETAITNAEAMEPTARVAIRMPRYAFEGVVGSGGKYKTVHETKRSRGSFGELKDTSVRKRAELDWSLAPGDDEPNVVYGYLDDRDSLEQETDARGYGDLTLVLGPNVIKRTTFTHGDSMNYGRTSLLDFKDAMIIKEARRIAKYSAKGTAEPYVEAQILGGVSFDDVEAIHIMFRPESVMRKDKSGQVENWSSTEELNGLLTTISKVNPEIKLIIEIPATNFPASLLEVAEQFPNAEFVYLIELDKENIHQGEAYHPFTASFRADIQRSFGENEKAEQTIANSNEVYEEQKQRIAGLREKVQKAWEAMGHSGVAPQNVRFVIRGGK